MKNHMQWQERVHRFVGFLRSSRKGSLVDLLDLPYEAQMSSFFELSPIQDAFSFRARYLGWKIAHLLVNPAGELQEDLLQILTDQLSSHMFCLGPKRESDCLLYNHLLFCLKKLPEIWPKVAKFSLPLCHKLAEKIVKETLWPETIRSLDDCHIRRAVLASWFTWLRQSVGSCFATAPAILVQKQPELFFQDLLDLLNTGQLKRVVAGQQYAVPMCFSSGEGELDRPILETMHLSFCPGLIAALDAADFFAPDDFFLKKSEKLRSALANLSQIKTPRQLLHDLLLKSVGVTQEEVADEEYLASIQLEPLIARSGGVFYREPTPRARKVADWKKRLDLACLAFVSLTQCALLRVWEYTVASFCDVKTEFAKWNLYIGLGMQTGQEGGIADFLYRMLDRKLQEYNAGIQDCQQRYENAFYTMRSLESLLQRSSDDAKSLERHAEYSLASHDAQMALQEKDKMIAAAEAISGFFAVLLNHYDTMVPKYFQEIFDPSVLDAKSDRFEDSPAGFRLLYKHGRQDASAWTLIYDAAGYKDALRSFFSSVESEIPIPFVLGKEFIAQLTTELIQYVQSNDFLDKAKARSQAFGRASPWNYVSGGTMQGLVQAYKSRSGHLTEKAFFPKSEAELLQILAENRFEKGRSLLMHSPTHAFILNPDLFPEQAVRFSKENLEFGKFWEMNEEKQDFLASALSEKLNPSERPLFIHRMRKNRVAKTPLELRLFLLDALAPFRTEEISLLWVDAHLHENTLLFSKERASQAVLHMQKYLPQLSLDKVALQNFSFIGSSALHELIKDAVLEVLQTPQTSVDWDQKILESMQKTGLVYPHLILFGDTNWSDWFFGFVSNMYTGKIELWRLNRIGTLGCPMHGWKRWFSPENKSPWIVLSRFDEYSHSLSR